MSPVVRVALPQTLRELAGLAGEARLDVPAPVTQAALIDSLESAHPALRGLLRQPGSDRRRPFVRFFACKEDRSFDEPDAELPPAVAEGREPFVVVGAIAGG